MKHFKNNALRTDIGNLLELNLTSSDNIWESSVGGYSIEVQGSQRSITSYVYNNQADRDEDINKLKQILNLV